MAKDITIKIYKRRNDRGEIVGYSADIKVGLPNLWTNIHKPGEPRRDYHGYIWPTKAAALEAAKAELIRRRAGKGG